MTLLRIPEASALRGAEDHRLGYVRNHTRVFALGPAVYAAWTQLVTALRAGMDERRDELVTLAAVRRLRARYCVLAHATVLQNTFFDTGSLLAIAVDRHGSDATHATTDDSYDALDPTLRAAVFQPSNGGHHDQ